MKRLASLALTLLLCMFFTPQAVSGENKVSNAVMTKIRIQCGEQKVLVALYDNPVSRHFASMLPLSVTFRDYIGEEKIANLPQRLPTEGGLTAKDAEGDFTYYAPWGNLAVFYKGSGKDGNLYILGRIESGKEWLAGKHKNFTARIEIAGQAAMENTK